MAPTVPPPLLRVFPSRTSFTPDDEGVRIGYPSLWDRQMKGVKRVDVSCCFTWEIEEANNIGHAWKDAHPQATVSRGGPACGDPGGPFKPGKYIKRGVSISSRGCPNHCPWCLVPIREGGLRLYDICEGHIINDNNILAFPRHHFEALFTMLRNQKRAAEFPGGLQASLLKPWHVEQFKTIKVRQLFLAADHSGAVAPVKRAVDMLEMGRHKVRCYALIGYGGEPIERARERLENIWEAGALPFAQLYRPVEEGVKITWSREWRDLARTFSRPAATVMAMKGRKT